MNPDFYRGKRVLVTGHTGFKGSWLTKALIMAGAEVTGFSLPPVAGAPFLRRKGEEQGNCPAAGNAASLFRLSGVERGMSSRIGDIRDLAALERVFEEARPEIVLHLAAQPIVRTSYEEPVYTYETNVMGTVHVCECVRKCGTVRSFLNVTTDKVYLNREWEWGYRENEMLDGYDPYSNSKSCSELVTHSYERSFLAPLGIAVSTARAGNVIGGGDFADHRIVPDCVRAVLRGERIEVRNPNSVRPYQHVLEPVFAYLMIAERQFENAALAGSYNVGPGEADCLTTGEMADLFCTAWGGGAAWETHHVDGPHEAGYLRLDCAKLRNAFGWKPRWSAAEAVRKTVEWTKEWARDPGCVPELMERQILEYLGS